MPAPVPLRRSLGLGLVVLYGLGTTIGAGIYVLVGKTVGVAGMHAPFAFLMASLVAAFSAFSFAELSRRYPFSAGEALYVHAGFGSTRLALGVGLAVVLAGLISSAAILIGFAGYVREFLTLPAWLVVLAATGLLGAVAAWGVRQSVSLAAILTVLEITGLLVVIWGGRAVLGDLPQMLPEMVPPAELAAWAGVLAGAMLAFYAFLGFEDMVNVAEEVRDVGRVLPRAIILTLVVTTLLYLLLSVVAIGAVPIDRLAASEAPLALLFRETTGASSTVISLIAMVSVLNGALIQIIMASRVIYGLSRQQWVPEWLGAVQPRTQTPVRATLLVTGAILVLALALPLATLAEATSVVALSIFTLVNLALLRIKRVDPHPVGVVTYPAWIPLCGFVASLGLLGGRVATF